MKLNAGWRGTRGAAPCEVCGKPRGKGTDHARCMDELARRAKQGRPGTGWGRASENLRLKGVSHTRQKAYLRGDREALRIITGGEA